MRKLGWNMLPVSIKVKTVTVTCNTIRPKKSWTDKSEFYVGHCPISCTNIRARYVTIATCISCLLFL